MSCLFGRDSLDSDSDRPFSSSSSSSSSEEGAAAEKSDSDWGDVSAPVEEAAANTRKVKRVLRKASSNIEDAFAIAEKFGLEISNAEVARKILAQR